MNGAWADWLWCGGLILLSMACFQSRHNWVRRIGLWLIFVTIGLGLWFSTHQISWVLGGLTAWFAIPVAQALYLSRQLRFSRCRQLTPRRINAVEFHDISRFTAELRDLGFITDADYWLEPSPVEQGFRLFHHPDHPVYAALAIVRQAGLSLYYAKFISRDRQDHLWITWDYPLTYSMKMPPEFRIHRCVDAENLDELFAQHLEFLLLNEVESVPASDATPVAEFFNHIFESTVTYNLQQGLLQQVEDTQNEVAYSWRGTFFVSWQVLLELVHG